jgi:hypothetical protein
VKRTETTPVRDRANAAARWYRTVHWRRETIPSVRQLVERNGARLLFPRARIDECTSLAARFPALDLNSCQLPKWEARRRLRASN